MRRTVLAISIAGLAALCLAQKLRFTLVDRKAVVEHARNIPENDRERAAQLKQLFLKAGCRGELLTEQKIEEADAPNIICELKGESAETIIVGAHYEHASSSARPIDNWTGASLLPSLYECLHDRRRHHHMIFVAFADQGNKVEGAEYFAAHLSSRQLAHVEAMVNVDALGLSPTKVWTAHSDKDLVAALVRMMYAMKISASQIDIAAVGNSDSDPFAARDVPQITVHSMTQQNVIERSASSFREENYYDSYRLLSGYLAYLDAILKPRSHTK
jgi:hypothetical protein